MMGKSHSRLVGEVAAFAWEFRVALARVHASADVAVIVVSIYHAVNVALLRHVGHHEGLKNARGRT